VKEEGMTLENLKQVKSVFKTIGKAYYKNIIIKEIN
jgi:hypothetical protein